MAQLSDDSRLIPEDVLRFCNKIGYPVHTTKSQRITGPILGKPAPGNGTEIFVSNLPKYLMEDYLIPYFQQTGEIYKFRLMITNSVYNRGSAFITYNTVECANESATFFNEREIFLGQTIFAEISRNNRRLFLGGIPDTKSRDEVWHELQKLAMKGIVDVIMYRSYSDKNRNRGFVFVEFNSHQEAAQARFTYKDSIIFGQRVSIDWSSPINDVADDVMSKVKILFLRNLDVCQERDEFVEFLRMVLAGLHTVEKIYKFRDYAFVHFKTRRDAQKAMWELKNYYKGLSADVEIEWAKPPQKNKNTQPSSSKSAVQDDYPTPATCNCTCKHSYIPSPEREEKSERREYSPPRSLQSNYDFESCLQSTPLRRTPFHHLTNSNDSRSQVPAPLFTPPSSSSQSSLPMGGNSNLQSSSLSERTSSLKSLWQMGMDLSHSGNYKD